MPISSPGVGSGLDVRGIVSSLMAIEQQPLNRLNAKEAMVQAEISAYGLLKGGLSDLQDAMAKLQDITTFQATKATSSNTDIFSATSTTEAVASSYNVTVNRLAQQHKLGSSEFASTDTFGGAAGDELTMTVNGDSFTLDLSTAMTLSEIQTAINVDSNATGVTAGLITGDSGNQTLVLTSGSAGANNSINLSFGGAIDSSSFNLAMLNSDENDVLLGSVAELDASLSVDGVTVTRSSNSIDDVISGLTIDLAGIGTAKATIGQDSSVASSAVKGFVDAYNGLKDQLVSLKSSGANSSVLRNIENQLRGVLNTGLSGLGDYSYISELGVTTNSDTGKLEFDSEMMTSALEDNPASVASFFSDDSTGFALTFSNMLDGFIQSGGTIDSILDGARDQIDGFERSRESLQGRLEAIEQRYLKQFSALDTMMSSLSSTSEFLGRQLDSLENILSRDS